MVTDGVLHVAAIAKLVHRQEATDGSPRMCRCASAFDLPQDPVGPSRLPFLGAVRHAREQNERALKEVPEGTAVLPYPST